MSGVTSVWQHGRGYDLADVGLRKKGFVSGFGPAVKALGCEDLDGPGFPVHVCRDRVCSEVVVYGTVSCDFAPSP